MTTTERTLVHRIRCEALDFEFRDLPTAGVRARVGDRFAVQEGDEPIPFMVGRVFRVVRIEHACAYVEELRGFERLPGPPV